MKLTENFTLSEMVKSETALRHGLDNTPRDIEIANLSDSDPGETAFAKIQLRNKSHFIQKDGTLLSASDATQPPHFPSRDPVWLPK